MDEQLKAKWGKWEQTRARGFWHFALLSGVVKFGGLTLIFMYVWSNLSDSIINLWRMVPIYMAGGFFWGVAMWIFLERQYKHSVEDQAVSEY